jgi:hypothetical protein
MLVGIVGSVVSAAEDMVSSVIIMCRRSTGVDGCCCFRRYCRIMEAFFAKLSFALVSKFEWSVRGSRLSSSSGAKIRALPIAPECIMTRPKAEKVDTICMNKNNADSDSAIDHGPMGSNRKKKIIKDVKNA